MFAIRDGQHRALTNGYYILRLKMSIISLGQLDENGCPISINAEVMSVRDRQRQLLAKVMRSPNHLYKVCLQIMQPVCLSARIGDDA